MDGWLKNEIRIGVAGRQKKRREKAQAKRAAENAYRKRRRQLLAEKTFADALRAA